jgi:hypothetical protein
VNNRRPPRFPYVAALLCGACLGAAVWTWMRYSYAWDVTPRQVVEVAIHEGAYVHLHCLQDTRRGFRECSGIQVYDPDNLDTVVAVVCPRPGEDVFFVKIADPLPPAPPDVPIGLTEDDVPDTWDIPDYVVPAIHAGRVRRPGGGMGEVWVNASRFHGASIAGLVVGAMGVFVFAVALRHWLNQRRASHVDTAESDT